MNKNAILIERGRGMSNDYCITPEDFKRAEENGISNERLRQRVYGAGWSKEEAINTPLLTPSEAMSRAYKASPFNFNGTRAFWAKK